MPLQKLVFDVLQEWKKDQYELTFDRSASEIHR